MNLQRIALVSFAVVVACCGHIGSHVPGKSQNISPEVYCGRPLARNLAMLCFEPPHEKRSKIGTMYIKPTHGVTAKGGVKRSCGTPCTYSIDLICYVRANTNNATL